MEAAAGMDEGLLTAAGSAKRLGLLESDDDSVYESASDGDENDVANAAAPFWSRVDVSEWGEQGTDCEAKGVEKVIVPTMALLHPPHAVMRAPLTQVGEETRLLAMGLHCLSPSSQTIGRNLMNLSCCAHETRGTTPLGTHGCSVPRERHNLSKSADFSSPPL